MATIMEAEKNADNLELLTDDELVARCREGIEAAERELLGRYMQAIYWLPHRILGVPEDDLADFLIFAIEKIRERDTLAKFEPTRGARFATWLSVIIRNLYIDYLRSKPEELPVGESEIENIPAKIERRQEHADLLAKMQQKCRVTFKLLLCDTFQLTSEDLQWIAQESGRSLIDTTQEVAKLEERLRADEMRIAERYDKLARAYYWKNFYARQIKELERKTERPNTEDNERLEKLRGLHDRRQAEYDTLNFELSGIGGIVTAPYKDLSRLLKTPEGTLASNISRCRSGAADLLRRMRGR